MRACMATKTRSVTLRIVLTLVPGVLPFTSAQLPEFALRDGQHRALQVSSSSSTLSPFTVCPEEVETCYEDAVCLECVSESTPLDEEQCRELYPVLKKANVTECEDLAASICCTFDLIDAYDCRTNAQTLEFWKCGMEYKNCSFDTLPCDFGSVNSMGDSTSSMAQNSTSAPSLGGSLEQPGSLVPTVSPSVGVSPNSTVAPTAAGGSVNDVETIPSPTTEAGDAETMSGAVRAAHRSGGFMVHAGVLMLWIFIGRLFVYP